MFIEQGGRCAICGEEGDPDKRHRPLAIDHDHDCCPTNKGACGDCVRGLLCGNCNNGLGRFGDDPALLRRAIEYLEKEA